MNHTLISISGAWLANTALCIFIMQFITLLQICRHFLWILSDNILRSSFVFNFQFSWSLLIMFIILDSHYHPSWPLAILHDHHPILQDDHDQGVSGSHCLALGGKSGYWLGSGADFTALLFRYLDDEDCNGCVALTALMLVLLWKVDRWSLWQLLSRCFPVFPFLHPRPPSFLFSGLANTRISILQISAFFLFSNIWKGRLLYIHPVGWLVGRSMSPLIFSIYTGIKALY